MYWEPLTKFCPVVILTIKNHDGPPVVNIIPALLKFDKKNLRSRMAMLKNDKFVQVRFIIRVLPQYKSVDIT